MTKSNFNLLSDKLSLFLFSLVYIIIIIQTLGIYNSRDFDVTSYLVIHKVIYYLVLILTIWSHLNCTFTDPGKITHERNPHYVEFFINIRDYAIQRAIQFNKTYAKILFDNAKKEDLDESDEYTDYDSYDYPMVTSILDDAAEKVSKHHNVTLKRCDRCFVIRTPGTRHCSRCQGCILKMDHHCPWVYNCIGQFNQKFFIQFLVYSLIGISEASFIGIYYVFYKDRDL